jgi:[ribosomal protein S18]-alanine N-acetyltransferase
MVPLTIRPARDTERQWAAGVMSASEPWITLGRDFDACVRACTSPIDSLYIAEGPDGPCGLALVRERGVAGAPYLVSIAVAPHVRNQGAGSQLLAYAESLFRGRYRHFFLCVSSFNPRARAFYERHGYQAAGVLPDFIVDGLDEILMMKRL